MSRDDSERGDASDDESSDGPVRFLLDPTAGTIEYASSAGAEWLDQERRVMLGELVDPEHLDESPCRLYEAEHAFELDPMTGALGDRLLVTVSERDETVPDVAEKLTDRQLEVAEHAASGATGPEIAESLDVEPSTIYEHLQNIYERLEINSRAELAGLVALGS